ncbi:hypothetical protein SAMN05444365_101939 [Micromonospora pattaloongensis]|uniref:Tryptophan-associated transmembrane protein (Trp_oprn_chp) n=1 Tax=Micromonospora pattaloongensis TaxID=405436 RepID=A0A1H3HRZ6_9ACTN|nr:hypothetical protein [Micromonospora pattaloongensis]SDY17534.1 hypothetical protein SAMN05444365_101939 [Micromonospora pattaloongensis]
MSQQHPVDGPAPGPTIVAWGPRRGPLLEPLRSPLTAFARDPRVVTGVAALGTAAVAGSLFGEWAVTAPGDTAPAGDGPPTVPQTVNDIGSFGTTYLVGVLALTGCVALALFGAPAVRRELRVAGLALAGGLLVMLGALLAALHQIMSRYFGVEALAVRHGRGLVLAFVGVAMLGAALLLARRAPTLPGGGGGSGDEPGRPSRRRSDGPGSDSARQPADLSVTPAPPFLDPEAQSLPRAAPPGHGYERSAQRSQRRSGPPPDGTDPYRRESRSGPR